MSRSWRADVVRQGVVAEGWEDAYAGGGGGGGDANESLIRAHWAPTAMGKKHQRDREERRERYAERQQKQSSKNKLIAFAVLATVVSIIAYAGYEFATLSVDAPGGPEGAGPQGSAHVHAGILVKIFGDKFDFALPAYQIKTSWIHFEGQNGDTIHRHATGVDLGYLFDSMSIGLTDDCYVFPDDRQFCTDDDYTLKFYINGEKVSGIRDYVVNENDRILVSYGAETEDEVDDQLQELQNMVLDLR